MLYAQVGDAPSRDVKNYAVLRNFKIKIKLESE
jgi:hypothetical protein